SAARAQLEAARTALERSAELSGEADCPLCGQALGEAFADVRSHRQGEVDAAAAAAAALEADHAERERAATASRTRATQLTRALQEARQAWAVFERARDRRAEAERARDA